MYGKCTLHTCTHFTHLPLFLFFTFALLFYQQLINHHLVNEKCLLLLLLCRMLECESKTMALLCWRRSWWWWRQKCCCCYKSINSPSRLNFHLTTHFPMANLADGMKKEEENNRLGRRRRSLEPEWVSQALENWERERERENKRGWGRWWNKNLPTIEQYCVCSVFRLFLSFFPSILSLSMARWQNTRLAFSQVVASSCFCLVLG